METGGIECDKFSIQDISDEDLAKHKTEALRHIKLNGNNLDKT